MSSRIFVAPESLEWKKAYLAAVFESDRKQIPRRVQHAKDKLSRRLRELWADGNVRCEEIGAIHDALHLLDALLSTSSYRHDPISWTNWDEDR